MRSMESTDERASSSGRPSAPVAPVKSKTCFILMIEDHAAPVYTETKIEQQELVPALKEATLSDVLQIDEIISGNHVSFGGNVFGPELLAGETQQPKQDFPAWERDVVRESA